ncbi:hypothetical protein FBY03_1114 [Pseudomonas sp. SJZ079]|nr:hypothetical protein FBY03_1114 [Pseudomonas sp. SJZ079]
MSATLVLIWCLPDSQGQVAGRGVLQVLLNWRASGKSAIG